MNAKFEASLNKVNPEIIKNPNLDLVEDGILDSLQIMSLMAEIEQAFEMEFDYEDILPENFKSPETIWALVIKRGGKID